MPYEVTGTQFQGTPPTPQQVTALLNQGEQQGWTLVEIVCGTNFVYVVFKR